LPNQSLHTEQAENLRLSSPMPFDDSFFNKSEPLSSFSSSHIRVPKKEEKEKGKPAYFVNIIQ